MVLLFIFATGCTYERHPQKMVSFLRGIVQGYRTKLRRAPPGSLVCSVYSTVTLLYSTVTLLYSTVTLHPQKIVSFLRGIVQGYRMKLRRAPPGSLVCSVYSTVTLLYSTVTLLYSTVTLLTGTPFNSFPNVKL